MRDYESTDLEGAAHLARDAAPDDRPSPSEYMDPPDECWCCGMELEPGDADCPRCGERT